MIRIITIIFVSILINLLFCSEIFAVSVTINSFPVEINSLDNFQVSASISGATNATNYLRVDLYKEGTTNYFGETYNGTDWYSGSDGKNYFPIQIQNSSASATIFAQFGNPTIGQYPGPGLYKLKIRRYTSSGSVSSNDTQSPVDVQITYVIPTPTVEPTATPTTPVPTPAPTPTKTPTTVPTPTKTPTPRPTPTLAPEILGEETALPTPATLVSDLRVEFSTISPTPNSKDRSSQGKFPVIAVIFIGIGVFLVGFSGYLAFKKTGLPQGL